MQGRIWKYQWHQPCLAKDTYTGTVTTPGNGSEIQMHQKVPKTKYGCIVESHESTRPRPELSQPKHHEDHIASKGYTSMTHCYLVHKFIPLPQAIKNPDAKAAVDKEWKKLEAISAWQLKKVKSKKEVIKEAQRNKKKVHFATLMDIRHLKNPELEPKLQKYKRSESFPVVTLRKKTLEPTQFLLNKAHLCSR